MGEPYPLPITFGEVLTWATWQGWDKERTGMFDRIVRALDTTYMEWWRSPAEVSRRKGRG